MPETHPQRFGFSGEEKSSSEKFTDDSNHPGSGLPGVELLTRSVSFFFKVIASLELTWSIIKKPNYLRNGHGKLKGSGRDTCL